MDDKIWARELNGVTESLLQDYKNGRPVDKLDLFNLPDKKEVILVTDKLMRLLFPGYFHDHNNKFYHIENSLTSTLEDVAYRLKRQIRTVLQYSVGDCRDSSSSVDPQQAEEESERIVLSFMKKLPEIRAYLDTDLEASYEGDPAAFSKDEIIFSYPGLYAIAVYRLAHELSGLSVPLIPRIMTEHAHSRTGIDIHPGASIGRYFFIDHGTGIVIGETTRIGDHVKIYQGVTLGGLSTRGGQKLRGKRRHPTIRDHVTIYSGASILGGDTVIGENVVIGSNAFITKSVEANMKVSVKNQELQFDSDGKYTASSGREDDSWCYII